MQQYKPKLTFGTVNIDDKNSSGLFCNNITDKKMKKRPETMSVVCEETQTMVKDFEVVPNLAVTLNTFYILVSLSCLCFKF